MLTWAIVYLIRHVEVQAPALFLLIALICDTVIAVNVAGALS